MSREKARERWLVCIVAVVVAAMTGAAVTACSASPPPPRTQVPPAVTQPVPHASTSIEITITDELNKGWTSETTTVNIVGDPRANGALALDKSRKTASLTLELPSPGVYQYTLLMFGMTETESGYPMMVSGWGAGEVTTTENREFTVLVSGVRDDGKLVVTLA